MAKRNADGARRLMVSLLQWLAKTPGAWQQLGYASADECYRDLLALQAMTGTR